jgi:hypothetical protein
MSMFGLASELLRAGATSSAEEPREGKTQAGVAGSARKDIAGIPRPVAGAALVQRPRPDLQDARGKPAEQAA